MYYLEPVVSFILGLETLQKKAKQTANQNTLPPGTSADAVAILMQ